MDHLIEKMKTTVKRGLVLRWAPALEGRLGGDLMSPPWGLGLGPEELGSHCGDGLGMGDLGSHHSAGVWDQRNCLGWGELWDLGLILSPL